MKIIQGKRLLNIKEVEKKLQIGRKTIFFMIADGRLKAIQFGKNTSPMYVEEKEINRLLKKVGIISN